MLRKHGKDDYSHPKAYRPIALPSTIAKLLESIIATRMSYMVEAYNLLPPTHMGGRRGRSCDHAHHLIMEKVHSAWRQGDWVASLLTLDVTGALDNVSHERLIHNLRKRHIPPMITQWLTSFLTNRRTTLTLAEGPMRDFDIFTGIPQGSPLSPILYLFYNADLIDSIRHRFPDRTLVVGYIDDICVLTWTEDWDRTHASRFSPPNYCLIHLTPKHRYVPAPM